MNAWIRTLALAALISAPPALGQETTELHARSYVLSAFITGAAHAIISDSVTLSPQLRERLALPTNADSRAVYEALIALTENKPLAVRSASADEARALPSKDAKGPLIAIEAGEIKLLLRYDLERNNIAYIREADKAAPSVLAAAAQPDKVIRLTPIHFDFDQAALDREAKERLEQEGLPKMVDQSAIRYVLRGHADDIGTAQYNEPLSQRRAVAVRDYLVFQGADPAKIEVLALGSADPQATCAGEKDRQALLACHAPNRRVEVEIHLPAF